MKKLIIASLLMLSAAAVNAQSLELIPKAGLNIARQDIGGVSGEKSKIRFQGGLAFKINTTESFAIQPELNFVGKGAKIQGRGTELNYLELPVLAKYSFGLVYINAGPSIGLRIGGDDNQVAGYAQGLKRLDFGVQAGAGLAIPVGKNKFIIDGRYGLGLSNIVEGGSVKNRSIMASIGYAIAL